MNFFSGLAKNRAPQMTKNEIAYIQNLGEHHPHLVEFGSGISTLVWEQYFQKVSSIETRLHWYLKIRKSLKKPTTEYLFCPPESCAFGTNGDELWNKRNPSDYGRMEEFSGYYKLGGKLVSDAEEKAIYFVDGNLRREICEFILNKRNKPLILLHDVIPEREYLNGWTRENSQIEILAQIDSLLVLTKKT